MAQSFLDGFHWESEDARDGYGNLIQFLRQHGRTVEDPDLNLICAYFIQKDVESTHWWRETVVSQTRGLEEQIRTLQESVQILDKQMDVFAEMIRSQGQTIEALLKPKT